MVLGLLVNPWIALNMSPDDYAIFGYYTSFSTLLQPLIAFYLIQFYIKEYFKKSEYERETLITIIVKGLILFSSIMSIICFLGILVYLKLFNSDSSLPISPYLALAVFAIPFTGLLNLELAKLRMERNSKVFFLVSTFNGLLNILLMVVLVVFMKLGALGKLLGPLLCNIVVFLILLRKYGKYLRYKSSSKEFRQILIFCLPLTLSSALGYFTHGFDRTYLESIGDNQTYGLYIVGTSIGLYLSTFGTAVSNTFQPDLFETIAKQQWRKYFCVAIAQVGLIAGIVSLFILVAPFIIDILTAGRYIASTPFAQIISLSTISSSICFIIGSYCIATNRPRLYLYTTIIGSALIVIGMPIAVNKWNYYGGAWMTVVSYLGFAVINLLLLALSKFKLVKI